MYSMHTLDSKIKIIIIFLVPKTHLAMSFYVKSIPQSTSWDLISGFNWSSLYPIAVQKKH